jgi:hypothetical protein
METLLRERRKGKFFMCLPLVPSERKLDIAWVVTLNGCVDDK